jgi:hypothetical protein
VTSSSLEVACKKTFRKVILRRGAGWITSTQGVSSEKLSIFTSIFVVRILSVPVPAPDLTF